MTLPGDDLAQPSAASPPVPASAPWTTGAPPEHPELPDGVEPGEQQPRWRPWFGIAALVLGFLAATVGFVVVATVAAVFGADFEDPPPAVTIIATVLQSAFLIGAAVMFARKAAPVRPWQFGLRPARFWPSAGWTVVAFLTFLGISAAWAAAMDLGDEEDTLPDELGVDESTAALIAVAFLVTVVAPIGEEVFFRGFFFRALANWRGIWPAALITGIVFGGIHAGGSPVGFLVPLGVFGVVLCLLYARTKSLYPAIVLHAINNSIAFGASQDWTWEIPVLLACSLVIIWLAAAGLRRAYGPAPERPLPV